MQIGNAPTVRENDENLPPGECGTGSFLKQAAGRHGALPHP
jgi:hypothetical protein